MTKLRVLFVLAVLLVLALSVSGRFLVVSEPRKSDVIVVLGGDADSPPARGLELLNQGYAPRLLLDVPAETKIYQWNQSDLAQRYVQGLPQASQVTICPIYGLSTKTEVQDVSRCLQAAGVKSVLLVTSDYHTRRSLSIFRKALPGYDYSVAPAFYEREFGTQWWRHREWAKTYVEEWAKLIWWELVDRWR